MVWNPVSVKKTRSIRNGGSRQLALCMVGASRASEVPSEAIAAGIGIETRPWPPSATLLSRLGDKHFLQEEKQPSNILKKTITKVYLFAKKQNVIPTEVHTRSDAAKQITLPPPPLYSISSPNPCLSASKAGRVTTLDVTCDAQFLVTLQSKARQATPAHRQPSLSLKQITTYYVSCLHRLCLPVLQGSWVSKGSNHTVLVSSVSYVAQALEGTIWSLLALGNVSRTAVREEGGPSGQSGGWS